MLSGRFPATSSFIGLVAGSTALIPAGGVDDESGVGIPPLMLPVPTATTPDF